MERRDLLRVFGAATALAFLSREDALAAWERVATERLSDGLSGPQLTIIGSIADTILPRTGSPSATDVGVPAFIDVIVSEYYSDAERLEFLAGLSTIGEQIGRSSTVAGAIDTFEAARDRRAEPARTYWRLKGLIIHGYFTSRPVMRDVLHFEIMPGRFDGAAPMRTLPVHIADDQSHA